MLPLVIGISHRRREIQVTRDDIVASHGREPPPKGRCGRQSISQPIAEGFRYTVADVWLPKVIEWNKTLDPVVASMLQ